MKVNIPVWSAWVGPSSGRYVSVFVLVEKRCIALWPRLHFPKQVWTPLVIIPSICLAHRTKFRLLTSDTRYVVRTVAGARGRRTRKIPLPEKRVKVSLGSAVNRFLSERLAMKAERLAP